MKNLSPRSLNATELLRNINHAVFSPISSLLNLTEIILSGEDGEISDEVRQDVTDIAADIEHLQAICTDLMELCHLDSTGLLLEPLDLLSLIHRAVEDAGQRVSGVRTKLDSHIPAELPLVRANAESVYNLVIRLVSHVAQFTEQVTIHVHVDANDVVVCLGSGEVAPESSAEQSTPLPDSWLKDKFSVEMLLCKRLVELQGGELWASCPPGYAPALCFSLPINR